MKYLFHIAVIILCLSSCKKSIQEDLGQTELASRDNGIGPAPAYDWNAMTVPIMQNWPNNDPNGFNLIIQVNGDVYDILSNDGSVAYKLNNSTKRWEHYDDFILLGLGTQYLFSYQTKIYEGLTALPNQIANNFYSIDPSAHTTQPLAVFPGITVYGYLSFVIGNKGYLMGGRNQQGNLVNQFWEYNFSTNQWTNKGSSPLGARAGAIAMVIDDKAYIGLGYTFLNFNGQQITQYKNDWIKYDPNSIYQSVLADFPGERRTGADGFVLNGSAYIGFGSDANNSFKDFFKYNTGSNNWSQQASWPSSYSSNRVACFSIGNTGYLTKGALAQFWNFSNSIFAR